MVAQCLRFTTGHSIKRHGTVCAVSDEPTLAEVIADRKGDRSYDRLAADCGGTPSAGRLHQMATKPLKNFPDPDSIRGMASGLGVTVTEVVMASARSLDLNVYTGNDPNAVTIGGAGTLPASSREVLATVARELIRLTSQTATDGARNGEEQEPWTQESSQEHSSTSGRSSRQPGAPIVAAPAAPEPVVHRPKKRDKSEALIDEDQGSQADHELAARKGETEDEIRERLGIPYD